MKILPQESFEESDFDASGLNLHTSLGRRDNVAVFVHGFCGGGYSTWRGFPSSLFDGTFGYPMDVATMDYRSGYRTPLGRGRNPSIAATDLAAHLTELGSSYRNVHVVAHSLGGLVTMAAVEQYFDRQPELQLPLKSIFFFGSPRYGSKLAMRPLRWYNRELDWLHKSSAEAERLDKYFNTSVQMDLIAANTFARRLLPTFLCIAKSDKVADSRSTTFGHSAERLLSLEGGHSTITKPGPSDHSQVDWLYKRIDLALGAHEQAAREERFRGSALKQQQQSAAPVQAWIEPSHPEWFSALLSQIGTDNIAVFEHSDLLDDSVGRGAILISIHEDRSILEASASQTRELIKKFASRRTTGRAQLWAAIVVGKRASAAQQEMLTWIGEDSPAAHQAGGIFVQPASSDFDLPEIVEGLLGIAANSLRARSINDRTSGISVHRGKLNPWRSL